MYLSDSATGPARAALVGRLAHIPLGAVLSAAVLNTSMALACNEDHPPPGFLADRLNRFIAGTILGIVGYWPVVLRPVRSEVEATGVGLFPRVSVTGAIVPAFVALGRLLVFIHNMGTSIQVSRLASRAAATGRGIERRHGHAPDAAAMDPAAPPGTPPPVALPEDARVAAEGRYRAGRMESVNDLADARTGSALADARTERDARIVPEGMASIGHPAS